MGGIERTRSGHCYCLAPPQTDEPCCLHSPSVYSFHAHLLTTHDRPHPQWSRYKEIAGKKTDQNSVSQDFYFFSILLKPRGRLRLSLLIWGRQEQRRTGINLEIGLQLPQEGGPWKGEAMGGHGHVVKGHGSRLIVQEKPHKQGLLPQGKGCGGQRQRVVARLGAQPEGPEPGMGVLPRFSFPLSIFHTNSYVPPNSFSHIHFKVMSSRGKALVAQDTGVGGKSPTRFAHIMLGDSCSHLSLITDRISPRCAVSGSTHLD